MTVVEAAEAARLIEQFPILAHFSYAHLPLPLQEISAPFQSMALAMAVRTQPTRASGAETAAGLRKLLEAKDCAVRAVLPERP